MPKRTFWLVTGAALGAGSSLWAERRVRRTVQQAAARLQPDALVVEVGRSARQVAGGAGERLRDALSSGRQEMMRREDELWSDLAASGVASDLAVPTVRAPLPVTAAPLPHEEPVRIRRSRGRRIRPTAKSPSDLAR